MAHEQSLESAKYGYRANFRAMACGGRWHYFEGSCGPVLDREDYAEGRRILVADVQALGEKAALAKLSVALSNA